MQAVHKQAPAAKWAAHWRAARTKSAHNLYCSALSFIAIGGRILCRLGECCITGSHHRNGPTPVQQPPLPVRLSDLSEGLPGWYNLHLYLYTLPCVSKPRPCLKVRTTLRAQSFKGNVKFYKKMCLSEIKRRLIWALLLCGHHHHHHHHLLKKFSRDKTSLQQLLIEFSEEKKLPAGVQSLHSDQSADRLSDRLTFPCHTQHHLFTFCSFVDFDFLAKTLWTGC